MNNSDYKGILNADQRKIAEQAEKDPSLFDVVAVNSTIISFVDKFLKKGTVLSTPLQFELYFKH